jgi:hypothetical protein
LFNPERRKIKMGSSSSRKNRNTNRRDRIGRSGKRGRRFQKDALMDRMKKSQEQAEGGRGVIREDVDVTIWRPKDGYHAIDIIPYAVGKYNVEGDKPGVGHYCFRYFYHRNVGPANRWAICPLKTWGKDCPICEERQRLIDDNADWDKIIKPLFSRERYLYNIVCYDRGEEKKGVQVWDVSNHYFQKHIIKLSKKPARGGRKEQKILFFDEEEGKTITFTIEPPQSKEDFAEYVAHAFEDRDYTITDDILDQAHCLDEIVQIYTYDELSEMFFGKQKGESSSAKSRENDLLDDLDDIENNEELLDFCDDNDIDIKLKGGRRYFDDNVDKVRDFIESMGKRDKSSDENDLLDDLDDIENNDELQDFCDDNDIDIRLKGGRRHFPSNIDKVKNFIESMEEGNDPEITTDDIDNMNKRQLKRLIKDENLDIDPRDFDDEDELRDEIVSELGLLEL